MHMKYWCSLDSHFTAFLSNDALVYIVENRIDPEGNIKHWFVIRKLEIVSIDMYVMPRQKESCTATELLLPLNGNMKSLWSRKWVSFFRSRNDLFHNTILSVISKKTRINHRESVWGNVQIWIRNKNLDFVDELITMYILKIDLIIF